MRAKRLGMVLVVAAASLAFGCLDNGGGDQDQWMNTDAYVGPEVGTSGGDGGVTCGDAPSFGSPTRLSDDLDPDGGTGHIQYNVAMAGGGGDAGAGGVNLAWLDRSLSTPLVADLRAVRVPAGSATGTVITLSRPTSCDALVDPALTVTAAGTAVLAATCVTGTEAAPTATQIVVFRSTNGLESFETPFQAPICPIDTNLCNQPSVVASSGSVLLAWTDWTMTAGTVTAMGVKAWRSDDDAVSLTEEITLPPTFAASSAPRLGVSPTGEVHLAFNGALTLNGTNYAAHAKLDTATAFAPPELLGPGSDPRLAVSGDGVYVVWTAGSATLEEAHDTGSGFSPGLPITQPAGTTAILSPGVAADPDGHVHLFWLANATDGWRAYYSVTTDLGAGWSDPLLISGPFDGDRTGGNLPHTIGLVDLVADSEGVTLGWGDTATTEATQGVTNVYLAQRVCP